MNNIKEMVNKKPRKETILQYGEGNFLRAFVDWMIDISNERNDEPGDVVIVQPIKDGLADMLNEQNSIYTLSMRGNTPEGKKIENRIITSVSRAINPYMDFQSYKDYAESDNLKYVISNTTEAGISYHEEEFKEDEVQDSFPAKVAQLLYLRYKKFSGDTSKGLVFFPVELIDDNGHYLKKYVNNHIENWGFEDGFRTWVNQSCHFTSTLVDRIVTGRPSSEEAKEFSEENGYEDKLLVFSELFNLWVIEGDKSKAPGFEFENLPCNVIWTDDVSPYKKRKVRILNGGHTSTVPAAVIHGYDIVRDFMEDEVFNKYFNELIDKEVIPTIDLPKKELEDFKNEVSLRFNNPYVDHRLLDITLNSISKFNARCLPSAIDYYKENNEVPKHFAFSLAALIRLYKIEEKSGEYIGKDEKGREYQIKDDQYILDLFAKNSDKDNFVEIILNSDIWDINLDELGDFKEFVIMYYEQIESKSIKEVMREI